MWNLWLKSKTFGQLPSQILNEGDSLASWMLDTAVMWFGLTIENALQERVKVGMGANVEYNPKYTLARLLNQGFKLPPPQIDLAESSSNPWATMLTWADKPNSGVRRWVYTPPEEEEVSEDE